MRFKKQAVEHIKEVGIDKTRQQGVIWYANNFISRCRRCSSTWNKYKNDDEQDLNKILDRNQYCEDCNKKLETLWKLKQ